jgi:serine protease DegQ
MPSVVNIFTRKALRSRRPRSPDEERLRRFFGLPPEEPQENVMSLGSGVIVRGDGYILTNNHVVEGAQEIAVALRAARTAPARIVGTDPDTDLAVLKVDVKNLPPIAFGDSDRIQVGDIVLAIGDPFGVGQTVTMGIVSATGRKRLGINPIENFIQTDAAINPGNSGGALVDTAGNLVGVNSAIFSETGGSQGIGFAIPVNMARQVLEQIIQQGRVERGWLGVQIEDLTPELAEAFKLPSATGALVTGVDRGGPADKAGMKPGDVVRAVGGKPVQDTEALLREVTALAPGQRTEVTLVREGRELRLTIEAGRRPAPQPRR